jgi:hypothetical protein
VKKVTHGRIKPKAPQKFPAYLSWLHDQPCIVTGASQVIAHHLTSLGHGRITRNDRYAVPLIETLHAVGNKGAVHEIGHARFEIEHGVDLVAEAERLWKEWSEIC